MFGYNELRKEATSFNADALDANKSHITTLTKKVMQGASDLIARKEEENANGAEHRLNSSDWMKVREIATDENVARMIAHMCSATKVKPAAIFERVDNVKAYRKVRELALLITQGRTQFEYIMHAWTMCALAASAGGADQFTRTFAQSFLAAQQTVKDTDGNERTLYELRVNDDRMTEKLSKLRAEHITTGASTQTSQIAQVLQALGVIDFSRDGRNIVYTLNESAPATVLLRKRYNMQEAA